MIPRSISVALVLVAACTSPGRTPAAVTPVSQSFEADSVDAAFRLRGRILGRLTVTSDSVVVLVDSATFTTAGGSEAMLAALNVGVARAATAHGNRGTETESRYVWIEQRLAPGRPLRIRDIRFAMPRVGAGSLTHRWLVFDLVTGEPGGPVGSPAVGFTPLHSSRRLFLGLTVPPASARARRARAQERTTQDAAPSPACRTPYLGRSGEVESAFVVDTLGRVEQGSIHVQQASSPDVAAIAQAVVQWCRFGVFRIDGRVVRADAMMTMRFR